MKKETKMPRTKTQQQTDKKKRNATRTQKANNQTERKII